MKSERILSMLYEMSLVIGGEVRLDPLCTKTLHGLLFHTSFPCGMVLVNTDEPSEAGGGAHVTMRLERAIGDYMLAQKGKTALSVPAALVNGKVELSDVGDMLDRLPCRPDYYRVFLRLPFGSLGTIILLAPQMPVSDLPVTEVFQPILNNFAKAFQLCRNNDAYTQQIEEDLRSRSVAIDQCPASVAITDLAARIQYVNPHFCRVTGYSAAEAIGRNPRVLQSGFTDKSVYEDLWKTLLQGGTWSGEFINKRKNGELYWEEAHIAPVYDKSGNVTQYVAVKLDVTERKQQQRELEQALESAQAASRAKSEFLATMSHEFRTPMNGIMGMTQLLEYTELTSEQREITASIHRSSDHLMSIITDILDLAKLESGRITPQCSPFSLRDTIDEVVKVQMPHINRKHLALTLNIPPGIPDKLSGDQLRLKQILHNLLGNAVKFTVQGEITVSVVENERRDGGTLLTIDVTDTGIGISPALLEKIFQPFVQADSSDTRQYGGTGLGLAICTRLTELMGGAIWVQSSEGAGSTFSVQIPFSIDGDQ